MRRDKAALFPQPTLQLSREHINTSQCATQGTFCYWIGLQMHCLLPAQVSQPDQRLMCHQRKP